MSRWLSPGQVLLATAILAAAGCFVFLPFIHTALNKQFPIKTEFTITSASLDGADLLVSGTFVKHLDCEYKPPPGAIDWETGEPLLVESGSKSGGISYPARPEPYSFGPWRVVDGAGRVVDFFHNDKCATVYIITRLGRYDARAMRQIPTEGAIQ